MLEATRDSENCNSISELVSRGKVTSEMFRDFKSVGVRKIENNRQANHDSR